MKPIFIFKFCAMFCFALLISSSAYAQPDVDKPFKDQQILDDLIVDGSACVGQDCVNGESFGFDTIRLKENNLRIRFQDTSTSGSFPTNDWQITANDSSNGGANKFSIDDIDHGRTPFTIEAGAPSHSLFVDDGGRIGLGTSTPVVEVHVVDGDTPTLRLEQDGSSGFTPQTWDVAGNETNFFVRDATNGSRIPFKIIPQAPTNSLYVAADGDVGLGTASPEAKLHINANGEVRTLLESADGNAAQIRIKSDSENRRFLAVNNSDALKSQIEFGDTYMKFFGANGTLEPMLIDVVNERVGIDLAGAAPATALHVNGTITHTGLSGPSDKRLKKNINSFSYGLNTILNLNPVSFDYNGIGGIKNDRTLVGLIAQDLQKEIPLIVNEFTLGDINDKGESVGSKNYLAYQTDALQYVLINAIKEQQAQLEEKDDRIEVLEEEVTKLKDIESEIATLKDQIRDLADQVVFDQHEVTLEGGHFALLKQNVPNPYDNETQIDYYLPEYVDGAKIQFHNMDGKLMKTLTINGNGKGLIKVNAFELPAGTYSYSLVINNTVVDTKKMVLTK